MTSSTILIQPQPPFDFESTAENQPYYRKGEEPGPDTYRRLLDLGEKLVLATVTFNGDAEQPELAVELAGAGLNQSDLRAGKHQIETLLGAQQDLRPFYQFSGGDPVMANLTRTFHGMHQSGALSVFETIVQAILGQQLSAHVARVIRNLMIDTYGPSLVVDGETHFAFPRPESLAAASIEELRNLKLSQRKGGIPAGNSASGIGDSGGTGQGKGPGRRRSPERDNLIAGRGLLDGPVGVVPSAGPPGRLSARRPGVAEDCFPTLFRWRRDNRRRFG